MANYVMVALTAAPLALVGCDSSGDSLTNQPPTTITQVAAGGFHAPVDAVSSPDGKTFYFAAHDDADQPAIFRVSSEPGSTAEVLAAGEPLSMPINLVMACDGKTLYVADLGGDDGALLAMAPSPGAEVQVLTATGLSRPGGLAMNPDCRTLHVTARDASGQPAVFRVPTGGGDAQVVFAGEPLRSPSGIHVDERGVSWVMDNLEGALFAVPEDGGRADLVVGNLRMGTPGGVSLTAGGGTALMPTRDADGKTQLTSVEIATGTMEQLAAPMILEPAGLRTARAANVFAVVDQEGDAIYRAE